MLKISDKFKITEVKSHLVDGVHKVDLSHNKDKSEWFVTIKGEFYTEFTFKTIGAANDMYKLCTESTNIFMDSLITATKRMSKHEPIQSKIDIILATSPEAIEYEKKSENYRMLDAEVIAYEEGN